MELLVTGEVRNTNQRKLIERAPTLALLNPRPEHATVLELEAVQLGLWARRGDWIKSY